MEKYIVITFDSTHVAMESEKHLEAFEIDMIPTPRQISTSCGISIKGLHEDHNAIKELLGGRYNVMSQCYEVAKSDGILSFKKI